MAAIWEPENKFRIWFQIEAPCDAQAKLELSLKTLQRFGIGENEINRIDELNANQT